MTINVEKCSIVKKKKLLKQYVKEVSMKKVLKVVSTIVYQRLVFLYNTKN